MKKKTCGSVYILTMFYGEDGTNLLEIYNKDPSEADMIEHIIPRNYSHENVETICSNLKNHGFHNLKGQGCGFFLSEYAVRKVEDEDV